MSEIINVPMAQQRDLKTVTAEIRTLTEQARRMAVACIVEIGRRLKEAKSMVEHGKWGDYLRNEVEYSQSTANNYMKIYEAYAADQITLDGAAVKSQAFANLDYSKALRLLAMPEEEREEFVQEHDVNAMSSRELDKVIRERDAAKAMLQDSEAKKEQLQKMLANEREASHSRMDECANLHKALAEAEREAQEKENALKKQLAQAEERLAEAQQEAQSALAQQGKPEVSPEMLEQIKTEAAQEAKDAFKEKEAKLKEKAKQAAAAEESASAEVERLKKQLAVAGPDMVSFRVIFEEIQQNFNKLCGILLRVEANDAEQAKKLRSAMSAMLENFGRQV